MTAPLPASRKLRERGNNVVGWAAGPPPTAGLAQVSCAPAPSLACWSPQHAARRELANAAPKQLYREQSAAGLHMQRETLTSLSWVGALQAGGGSTSNLLHRATLLCTGHCPLPRAGRTDVMAAGERVGQCPGAPHSPQWAGRGQGFRMKHQAHQHRAGHPPGRQ